MGIPASVTAIKVFNWLATLWRGSIELKSPMLYVLSFIILFSIGGLTGIPLATLATDVFLHDTYFIVAHFHYTMQGGTVIALLGGIHFWYPKITGKMYSEKVAVFGWILLVIGFNLTFIPQFVIGLEGMPRRYFDYLPQFATGHFISTVGSWINGAAYLIIFGNLLVSTKKGEKAQPNPWRSLSMEWQTSSPPPTENFVGKIEFPDSIYSYSSKKGG